MPAVKFVLLDEPQVTNSSTVPRKALNDSSTVGHSSLWEPS